MSRCATYNIFLQQGEARALHLEYVDKNGNPAVDLTGYEGVLQVREDFSDTAALLLELTSTNGEITFDATTGTIDITFPLTKVNDLEVGVRAVDGWAYALQIYDPADKENTARLLLRGEVTVEPTVVR